MVASVGPSPSRVSPRRATLPVWADIPGFTAFAQEVEAEIHGPELRYSRRVHLLARAKHFGISRFDANLIIAMVQHRLHGMAYPVQIDPKPRWSATLLAAAGITQLLIVAAVWWLVR